MIKYGIISFLIGLIGGVSRGAANLSKGEANQSYSTSGGNDFLGIVFMVLIWGGLLLIVVGIIAKLTNKTDQ